MHPEWLYRIALSKIPGVGAVIARTLVSYCGSPEVIFTSKKLSLLRIPGVGEKLVSNILNPTALREAEKELRYIESKGIQCVFYLDESYPRRLRHFPQSPIVLYQQGNADLNEEKVVAIIGTRKPTPYGKTKCEQIVAELKPYAPLIISGLAYGVDITAHRAALQNDMATLGVLGSGFGYIYPRAHARVAGEMMDRGGLLSEFGFETGPDRENFPARNRIVAGLADAVVVIESARHGGSMITVEYADAFHKDVFALPGRAGDVYSGGCNYLIKTQKAHLVESGEDIAGLLRWKPDTVEQRQVQRQLFADLSEEEQLLLTLIRETEEIQIDQLAAEARLQQSTLASVLLSLEFKGIIRTLPGKRYVAVS